MRARFVSRSPLAPALLFVAATAGCAPTFSELQSARLAGMERVEMTGSYSYVGFSADGESEKVSDQFGFQLASGIARSVDLRLRYERVAVEDADEGVNILGVGPKIGLVRDRVAFYVPIGFAFGGDIDSSETWQIHPTLLGTLPVADQVEVNGSAKVLFPFESDIDTTLAFNLGLGIGNFERLVLRPEVGFLINPGEDGHFRHFSIGLTYYAGR
jgi:hypothetical protein